MRRFATVLALSLVSTLSIAAEPLTPQAERLDDGAMLRVALPKGEVEITQNTVDGTGLFVHAPGSREALLESLYMPQLLKVVGDSALLQLNTGDESCPQRFAWLTFDGKALRTSGAFGTCAEKNQVSYESSDTGPVVTMTNRQYDSKTVGYRYNEKTAELTRSMHP